MTYFCDLSEYEYRAEGCAPGTRTVGWLDSAHAYETAAPEEAFLDAIWGFCKVSVAQLRGVHNCELCGSDDAHRAERAGAQLLLGTSEIRVFGSDGTIYAAPTLIYHYIASHHYKPPEPFVRAVLEGPRPDQPAYFDKLTALGLAWNKTSPPGKVIRPPKK